LNYAAAGVTGVQVGNIDSINSVIAGLAAGATDTAGEVQAIVDAYNAILNAADGTANGNATLTATQFQVLGLTVVNSASEALLLNAIVDSGTASSVDSLAKLVELARIVDAISQTAAGLAPSPPLTAVDLVLLGITGVTDANLTSVLAAIAATADDGSGINTLAKVGLIATTAAAQATSAAIAIISNYSGTAPVPTSSDYLNAGITGVGISNLAIINTAIATLGVTATDTAIEIQAVVNAYSAVIAAADGLANAGAAVTGAQFQSLGLVLINSAESISLMNSAIDALPLISVDTQAELAALGNTVAGIIAVASGGAANPVLTPQALAAIGLTGVTTSNLAFVLAAYTTAGVSGMTTISQVQIITSQAAAVALAAGLNAISSFDGSNAEPNLADFANAEVSGVTAINIGAVNSVLAIVTSGDSDTTVEIQPIVNAMQKVLVGADGIVNNGSTLTSSDFASLGLSAIDTSAKINVMNELIDRANPINVDTQSELAALANVVAAIIATSAGATPSMTLSVESFRLLGITVLNSSNLALMISAIAATPDDTSGVNSLAKIQAVAAQVVSVQSAALALVREYDGTTTEPLLETFVNLGVTGVDVANIAGINDYLAVMGSGLTDSVVKIQALVNAYRALSPGCDAFDNDNVNLTIDDWHALGYTEITTDEEIKTLNDFFDTEDWLVSGSAATTRSIVEEVILQLTPVPAPREGTAPVPGPAAGAKPSAPSEGASGSLENTEIGTPGTSTTVAPSKPAKKPVRPVNKPGSNTSSATNTGQTVASSPIGADAIGALVVRPNGTNKPVYPQAPRPGAGIREVVPGEVASILGGKKVVAEVLSSASNAIVLQLPGGLALTVNSNVPTVFTASTRSGNSRLQVLRGGIVSLQGAGFAPESLVDVTIYSEPTKLGVVKTDIKGVFLADLVVPPSIPAGQHTVKLDGITPEGELFTVSIGVEVLNPRYVDAVEATTDVSASGTSEQAASLATGLQGQWLLILFALLLCLGALVAWRMIYVRRRVQHPARVSTDD
jgi:hypothetical protein